MIEFRFYLSFRILILGFRNLIFIFQINLGFPLFVSLTLI